MKTLFILRHAKSSWDNPDLADFERPLNERGLQAAPFVGKLMRERRLRVDLILSSPARRAGQTATLVKEAAELAAELRYDERIYEASPTSLLYLLAETEDEFDSVLLVGHNPGLEGLIKILSGGILSMPTAALAEIELNVDFWSKIAAESGRLNFVVRPKDEMKLHGAN
ncbi:MAG TPA: histidine phosphatase family protein [Pyrinomonadaceae bacterium]|jgi:phosphohistidine phosphatase